MFDKKRTKKRAREGGERLGKSIGHWLGYLRKLSKRETPKD